MAEKVKTRKIDHRKLCVEADPSLYTEKEVQYEFNGGSRKFTKPSRTGERT